jgi:hypothetical protein
MAGRAEIRTTHALMRAILFWGIALAVLHLLVLEGRVSADVTENQCNTPVTSADFPCRIPDGADTDDVANQQFVVGYNDVQTKAMSATQARVVQFVRDAKDDIADVKADKAIDAKRWSRLKRVAAMAYVTTNFCPVHNKDRSDVLAKMRVRGQSS